MKHFSLILLYLAVPLVGLIGLQDSARQDRNDIALDRVTKRNAAELEKQMQALRQDLDQQTQAYAVQISSLQRKLGSSLAVSDTLQQEVKTLRTKLNAEVAARQSELELHAMQVASLSADVAETRSAIETERDAREQLSVQYECTVAEQGDLFSILQQLADASRARAAAQQQIAAQAAAEAASLARLAQQGTHAETEIVVEHEEVVHVAQAVPHADKMIPTASEVESADEALDLFEEVIESSNEEAAADELLPAPAQPDA